MKLEGVVPREGLQDFQGAEDVERVEGSVEEDAIGVKDGLFRGNVGYWGAGGKGEKGEG